MNHTYVVYGGELSYFTRKLEAAMIFYGADFQMRAKTPDVAKEIELRSGTHQVPVLLTPENWMIADTTPLIRMLDGRFPTKRLFPEGELGVLTQILEEYFDEWIARTMVHYRWHYEQSAVFASERMAHGNAEAAARVRSWGPRACRATGTDSEHQREAAEAEYHRIMSAAEAQLAETAYLLGDRPTALDCVVLGGLRAHTLMDPTPKAQMQPYKRVIAWAEADADRWEGGGELAPFPESTPFARFVLDEMKSTYQPFVLGNREALAAGAKAFHAEIYGEDVSYLCRPYPESSRQMIVNEIEALAGAAKESFSNWLEAQQLAVCFGG
ncbi:MAG: glutathione S-transferase family protein [Pseudomonadales bacterium]|jgi:glutathione S-transferase